MRGRRPQYGTLIGACFVALVVAGISAFAGLVGGGGFGATEPSPPAALAGWGIAGLAVGTPLAALPKLGFGVRTPVAVSVGAVVALTVAALGYIYTVRGY